MREDLEALRQDQVDAVIAGTLPIRVPAANIDDPVGSDRLTADGPGDETSSMASLIDNIRRRGLRQPLRVRPADPDWRPSPHRPGDVGEARFVLQSGRRRLAACRELGIDPLVFLSVVETSDARREDLQERFFENAARRDLSTAEKLFSIGMIAEEYPGMPQGQLAELLGVGAATVSRGVALLKHRAELERDIDLKAATTREIDVALARIRDNAAAPSAEAERKRVARAAARSPETALPFERRRFGDTELALRAGRGGRVTLTLTSTSLGTEALSRIATLVEELSGDSLD